MSSTFPPADQQPRQAPDEFGLVLGGPLYRLWLRARLSDQMLERLRHRIVVMVLLTWAPLLLLSIVERQAWGGSDLPFLLDAEMHLRLLLALPLLIFAEVVVLRRTRHVATQFLERDLVPDAARAQFDQAIASAMRLRDSVAAELILLVLVYGIGVPLVWFTQDVLEVTTWYRAVPADGSIQPSLAGWWLALVSLPIFQFLLLRWYFRLFIWARFLWQVSRIELSLVPTHPDRCGGLGFLSLVRVAFAPLLLAQGVVLAGMIADRIFFAGARLTDFKLELIGTAALMVFVILAPLLAFSAQLAATARKGKREYGTLAQRYAREFDRKWLRGGAPADEPFIGSADIQSLADLGNSYEVIQNMRWAPFTLHTALQLALTVLLPVLPLTLTMLSMQELVERLLKVIF